MMNIHTLLLSLSLLLAIGARAAGATVQVVATTPEYAAIATAIGGNRVAVTSLAKPTEDPHFVDAKPSHVVTLNKADLLIEGGAELEVGWLPPLLDGARNEKIEAGAPGHLLASEGIQLLDAPATLDRSKGDIHGAGNPHFMMDPVNAGVVARHIADALCAIDASGCASYKENLDRFAHDLEAKTAAWTAELSPFRGAAIVTYHPTWRYFANRFGLKADVFLEPKPGIPPSPPHLAEVIDKMKADHIKVILVEPYQQRKAAEFVASNTGATVVDVTQFPGGLPGTAGGYLALMDTDVHAVATALAAAAGH
jgi:zinc/manganese transport system substrate-binding protein